MKIRTQLKQLLQNPSTPFNSNPNVFLEWIDLSWQSQCLSTVVILNFYTTINKISLHITQTYTISKIVDFMFYYPQKLEIMSTDNTTSVIKSDDVFWKSSTRSIIKTADTLIQAICNHKKYQEISNWPHWNLSKQTAKWSEVGNHTVFIHID
jgi:hypothetical protein